MLGLLLLPLLFSSSGIPDPPQCVNEGVVEAPVGEVWKAITADADLRIGGKMVAQQGEHRILAFEAPHMIAFRMYRPPKGVLLTEAWKESWTVVTLREEDGGTHVRIASMAVGSDSGLRQYFGRAGAELIRKWQAHFRRVSRPVRAI